MGDVLVELVVLGEHVDFADVLLLAIVPLHVFFGVVDKNHFLVQDAILELCAGGWFFDLEEDVDGHHDVVIGLAEVLSGQCLVHHREQIRHRLTLRLGTENALLFRI